MTRDDLRALLLRALAEPAEPFAEGGAADGVPAAVLVGVTTGAAPGVLLTRRTDGMRQHPGQVAFPGGLIDPGDAGPEDAALREAREEIGLDPAHVEVLGRLGDYSTVTAYRITPVLALLPPDLRHELSPHEVAAVFELPLTVLMDPEAPRRESQVWGGERRHFWSWPHAEHRIWGATAGILRQLAQRLTTG